MEVIKPKPSKASLSRSRFMASFPVCEWGLKAELLDCAGGVGFGLALADTESFGFEERHSFSAKSSPNPVEDLTSGLLVEGGVPETFQASSKRALARSRASDCVVFHDASSLSSQFGSGSLEEGFGKGEMAR